MISVVSSKFNVSTSNIFNRIVGLFIFNASFSSKKFSAKTNDRSVKSIVVALSKIGPYGATEDHVEHFSAKHVEDKLARVTRKPELSHFIPSSPTCGDSPPSFCIRKTFDMKVRAQVTGLNNAFAIKRNLFGIYLSKVFVTVGSNETHKVFLFAGILGNAYVGHVLVKVKVHVVYRVGCVLRVVNNRRLSYVVGERGDASVNEDIVNWTSDYQKFPFWLQMLGCAPIEYGRTKCGH